MGIYFIIKNIKKLLFYTIDTMFNINHQYSVKMSTQLFSVIEKEAIVFWGSENVMLTILHISSLTE